MSTKTVTIFSCTRASDSPTCIVCGARAPRACTYPLRGRKAGQRCGRALCRKHAITVDAGEFCAAHYEATRSREGQT